MGTATAGLSQAIDFPALFDHVCLLPYTYPEVPPAPVSPFHESLGYLGHDDRRVIRSASIDMVEGMSEDYLCSLKDNVTPIGLIFSVGPSSHALSV